MQTEDLGLTPASGISPEIGNGSPLQCSCLENPMDRGSWRAIVHGAIKTQTDWVTSTFTFNICSQHERNMSVWLSSELLAWKSQNVAVEAWVILQEKEMSWKKRWLRSDPDIAGNWPCDPVLLLPYFWKIVRSRLGVLQIDFYNYISAKICVYCWVYLYGCFSCWDDFPALILEIFHGSSCPLRTISGDLQVECVNTKLQ